MKSGPLLGLEDGGAEPAQRPLPAGAGGRRGEPGASSRARVGLALQPDSRDLGRGGGAGPRHHFLPGLAAAAATGLGIASRALPWPHGSRGLRAPRTADGGAAPPGRGGGESRP